MPVASSHVDLCILSNSHDRGESLLLEVQSQENSSGGQMDLERPHYDVRSVETRTRSQLLWRVAAVVTHRSLAKEA